MSSIVRLARRELLCIADAQHHIRIGPMLRIDERTSPDRDPEIGLADLAELLPDAGVNSFGGLAYVGGGWFKKEEGAHRPGAAAPRRLNAFTN
jgi:hypothetical protein